MVRLSGNRILGYESGFDSAGRGLDALAEAGQIQNERKRQGVQDQQTAEAHTQLIQQLALKNKELQDKLDQLPKQHAQEQQVFDAQMQDRQRGIQRQDQQDQALSATMDVLGGGSGPQYDKQGLADTLGQGDQVSNDNFDEATKAHLSESDAMLKSLAPFVGKLDPQTRAAVVGPLMKQRMSGLMDVRRSHAKAFIGQMLQAGTLDDQRAQQASEMLDAKDPQTGEYVANPEDVLDGLRSVQKASKQKMADDNLRLSAQQKTDEMIASLPQLGVNLTPEQEQEIEDLRQDIVDPTVPTATALRARDKIRQIALNPKAGGKSGKAWHEHPAVEAILKDTLSNPDSAARIAEAKKMALGLGLDVPGSQTPGAGAMQQAPTQGPMPTPEDVSLARKRFREAHGKDPSVDELTNMLRSSAPQPSGGSAGAPMASGDQADMKARGVDFQSLQGKAGAQQVLSEGDARRMHAEDPTRMFRQVPGGYVEVK